MAIVKGVNKENQQVCRSDIKWQFKKDGLCT